MRSLRVVTWDTALSRGDFAYHVFEPVLATSHTAAAHVPKIWGCRAASCFAAEACNVLLEAMSSVTCIMRHDLRKLCGTSFQKRAAHLQTAYHARLLVCLTEARRAARLPKHRFYNLASRRLTPPVAAEVYLRIALRCSATRAPAG